MALLSLGGQEYSRLHFVAGYLLTVAWFTIVLVLAQRVRKRRFVLVPLGAGRSMLALQGAAWHVADSPDTARARAMASLSIYAPKFPAHWQQFLTSCALAGIPVYHYKDIREAITGRLEIEHLSENMLGSHNPHDGYRKFKRIVDFVTAAVAIVVLAPCFWWWRRSFAWNTKGPALFRQAR